MQVLCILTGTLLLTADLFALIGLAIPKWIVCDIGGQTSIGLLTICTTIYGRSEMCYTPNTFRVEWLVAFICVTIGVLCISIGFVLLVASHWKPAVYSHAKWFGFASVVTFCLAAVIYFPLDLTWTTLEDNHIGFRAVFMSECLTDSSSPHF